MNTDAYLRKRKNLVDKKLLHLYRKTKKSQYDTKKLEAALKHTLQLGGKRLRPIVAIAAYELFASDLDVIIGPAIGIELIHTGSLMLDDLPSMDNASYRRGKKTNHLVNGESITILASAGLWVKAFDFLSEIEHVNINELVHQTALFIGEQGLILGQYLDLFLVDKMTTVKQLEKSYELKTSVLFRLAVHYGGYLGGASKKEMTALDAFARHFGVAFQIRDDIIDATETLEQSGKDAHKDEINHKVNYVSLLGLESAKLELAQKISAAKKELIKIPKDCQALEDIANQLKVG